ncbi:S9 family peptidase [Frigoriflavimonas asaccharolytica]|uniref:Dipeptidyl-peptidase-4 n=1 Tax=Frigoriflavimonas asaccharolytica TaxID=2735899 RepID=A0A8J8G585_9FLAO|nr:DPP IV N-terminal domain-containing protein [Frigoriflavimonas asaccharolytica]NRS91373.1 dipeptidyl-peptidase-4 [Frigoriflavimonas asaccharolytica]
MKIQKIFVLLFFISQISYAQNQKFTMAEAVNGMRSNLAVKNISGFAWSDDGKSFYQSVKNAYISTDLKSGKVDTLMSVSKLNQSLSGDLKLKYLPPVQFIKNNKGYFESNGNYYWLEKSGNSYQLKSNSKIEDGAENIKVLNDKTILYTIKNNLYALKNGQKVSITNDSEVHIINGQAAHRSEFGIVDGTFPSPDYKNVAFYRMDETMVADYPIIDWSSTPAKNVNIKYPMAGQKSHEVSLGVYNFKNEKTTFLKIQGDPEQYLTAISWSPDSKFIFVGVLNRGQNYLQLNQYNAENGDFVKTLFEEKDSKYVEPQNPLLFFPNSSTDFIWQSQRSGYNHLFHYNLEKGLVSQITKGDWLVSEILGFNEKKKDIYFTSTKETPLERHLYRINWNTFKMEKLDSETGVHSGILSSDGNELLDVYSNADTPRKVNIINTSTLASKNLLSAQNPLSNYQRPEIKNITLKAEDGTPLYGKLILPTDFDASKKYPVIVYLYNGPHLQLITNTFPASGNLWYEYMAQRGYIIFTMDGRGSSNRGLKFEQAVHRNLGVNEMNDQMKGVEYLKSLPYVNSAKMGIHGWSFGGFMTTNLMLTYPDVFKAGVAGGPVIDWDMYEIMYTERYMDTPQENPEGYKNANLLNKVQNLKGKLLMIHGAQDNVVVWQHSIKFLKAAVDNGVQLDYFVYPGHEHNVRGKDRVHLMQKVTDYFDLYLKN